MEQLPVSLRITNDCPSPPSLVGTKMALGRLLRYDPLPLCQPRAKYVAGLPGTPPPAMTGKNISLPHTHKIRNAFTVAVPGPLGGSELLPRTRARVPALCSAFVGLAPCLSAEAADGRPRHPPTSMPPRHPTHPARTGIRSSGLKRREPMNWAYAPPSVAGGMPHAFSMASAETRGRKRSTSRPSGSARIRDSMRCSAS